MALKYGAPDVDVVTFAFENKGGNQDKPVRDLSGVPYLLPRLTLSCKILIDVNDPSRFVTPRTARTTVRKLVAGFKAEGLEPGDCVCIHSFNEVRMWERSIASGGKLHHGS